MMSQRTSKCENGDSHVVLLMIFIFESSLLFIQTFRRKSEGAAKRTFIFPNSPSPKSLRVSRHNTVITTRYGILR
ncbi:hypothetical protein L2E82_39093 [Cichorium intybus]|uniref:Uncharacterized protein n=1 Tax=Cichorium intybus TaxID=13427 RepID=A0ACB9AHL1_CICIN|nr:hypothetical protein L2E82_39093 [Cichorium intybus]